MKRFFNVLKSFMLYGFLILSLTVFSLTIYTRVNPKKEKMNLFGYQVFIVRSNSMAKTDFKAGDLIVTSNKTNDLKAGDIITFYRGEQKEVISHKIRKIETVNNKSLYTTYGSSNNTDDKDQVEDSEIIGRYLFKIVKLGYLLSVFKSGTNYLTILASILISIIVILSLKIFRILSKKKNIRRVR